VAESQLGFGGLEQVDGRDIEFLITVLGHRVEADPEPVEHKQPREVEMLALVRDAVEQSRKLAIGKIVPLLIRCESNRKAALAANSITSIEFEIVTSLRPCVSASLASLHLPCARRNMPSAIVVIVGVRFWM
jgi:hypothetical protein